MGRTYRQSTWWCLHERLHELTAEERDRLDDAMAAVIDARQAAHEERSW